MRSGLRLLVGYLCQVGGNSYLRCWPRNVVLSRATRAFSILLPFPPPPLPPPLFFLSFLQRQTFAFVRCASSEWRPRVYESLDDLATFGNYAQCRRIRVVEGVSMRRIDRFLSSILVRASDDRRRTTKNQDRRYFM